MTTKPTGIKVTWGTDQPSQYLRLTRVRDRSGESVPVDEFARALRIPHKFEVELCHSGITRDYRIESLDSTGITVVPLRVQSDGFHDDGPAQVIPYATIERFHIH